MPQRASSPGRPSLRSADRSWEVVAGDFPRERTCRWTFSLFHKLPLLAHELGHLIRKNSVWQLLVKVLMATFFTAIAAGAYFSVQGQIHHDPRSWLAAAACMVSCGLWASLWAFSNRQHEREADRFAVAVIGLVGAAELMEHNNTSNSRPPHRWSPSRLIATHPHPVERLSAMEAHFKSNQAQRENSR
ncbi:M48 family metalloprotease [Arthrobacter sp. UYEF20]|uniref:M48 family metalloprotease n=1 Tax=Arthrobacter sp. UYEF20 TaxID=1756363 RepID=UPI00339B4FD7